MKFALVFCSLMSMGITAQAVSLDSLRSEQRSEGLFVIHQVEEEETLYSIAKRYGGSVQEIVRQNKIVDNNIEIGQILEVLVIKKATAEKAEGEISTEGIHVVKEGETLYSISKMYKVKVKELKRWNKLQGDDISLGMPLKVSKSAKKPIAKEVAKKETIEKEEKVEAPVESTENDKEPDAPGFKQYLVDAGETLYSIAQKVGVSIDSLKLWNGLDMENLDIGQALRFKTPQDSMVTAKKQEPLKTQLDDDGFERIYEEGIASVIESMNTSKFLALHRSLPIGTNIAVRNLMNDQLVHVKVVGRLPDTGLNRKLLLRLSRSAYDQLGILDNKARVEVSYFKTQ